MKEQPIEGYKYFVLTKSNKVYLCEYCQVYSFWGKPTGKFAFRNILSKFRLEIEAVDWEPIRFPKRWIKVNNDERTE